MNDSDITHKIWHKFDDWLTETFGGNYNSKLIGYDAQCKIEKYAKDNPAIRILYCDDDVFASSILVLIPHPTMGISIMFVPQCTNVQNMFFLYDKHYSELIRVLSEMKYIYDTDKEKSE